jgi:sulfite oxidase
MELYCNGCAASGTCSAVCLSLADGNSYCDHHHGDEDDVAVSHVAQNCRARMNSGKCPSEKREEPSDKVRLTITINCESKKSSHPYCCCCRNSTSRQRLSSTVISFTLPVLSIISFHLTFIMLTASSLARVATRASRSFATKRAFSRAMKPLAIAPFSRDESILPFVAVMALGTATTLTLCDAFENTPSVVAMEDLQEVTAALDFDALPEYSSEFIAQFNGTDNPKVWMSYGGVVYDVTGFIANHPGGAEKIMTAAGSAVEPFWYLYRQHYASDLPMKLMEHMIVGRLQESDQDAIEEKMALLMEHDPYAKEPLRHAGLIVHGDTPMNAETPANLLTQSYLTPASLFYIRHHHPVPLLSKKQEKNYKLTIDLSQYGKGTLELTMDELKKLPKTEITATLQCSGNRRSGFNDFMRTSGTPWDQGAVSTAKWGGVKLTELMQLAGLGDPIKAQEKGGMEHVRFHSLDGMQASIGIEKAMNPYGDCIIAYEMNGEPLPRDHGYPVRAVVPGYAAVRNVKWVERIELAKTEAEGAWQQGLNYKTLPPSVTDAKDVDLQKMPSMTEVSLFSGITKMEVSVFDKAAKAGDQVIVKAAGWAWSGGGRNIVRVDLTGDDAKSWTTATITEGGDQRFGRAWAWVFWEADVEATVKEDGTVTLASKAVDMCFNVQPESSDHGWNVRGLGNNSWYRKTVAV